MKGMRVYYVSRAVISAAFGALFIVSGSPWWQGALVGGLAFLWFLYAPRSGRYTVSPQNGVTALGRDERAQGITHQAASAAFVAVMLVLMVICLYFGSVGAEAVPLQLLNWAMIAGALVYVAGDLWLRRRV